MSLEDPKTLRDLESGIVTLSETAHPKDQGPLSATESELSRPAEAIVLMTSSVVDI